MSENYKTIDSVKNLTCFLEEINKIQTKEDTVWYRGQCSSDQKLIPSVLREQIDKNGTTYYYNEQEMMYEFMYRAGQIDNTVPESKEYAKWLPIMQHYGLPTRLLDWTTAPLVALYFALQNENTDGAIWCINPKKLNQKLVGYYIPPIDYRSAKFLVDSAFNIEKDDMCRPNIIACTCIGAYLRMFTQQANFTIHSKRLRDLTELEAVKDYMYKIIIPKDIKHEFNQYLRMMGITEDYIYPDLEHIAGAIKSSESSRCYMKEL